MNDMDIVCSLSDDDALLALQAVRTDDIERSTTAMEAMSTEGLELLIALLNAKAEQRGIEV